MWLAETLRLTAFTRVPVNINNVDWWREISSSEPEIDRINRAEQHRVQEGAFSAGRLTLQITPERIDWFYIPVVKQNEFPPRLGRQESVLEEFVGLFTDCLQSEREIQRFALGVELFQESDNHADAYRFLGSKLPSVNLDAELSYDFEYQINRPRKLEICGFDEFRINRLSKWRALKAIYGVVNSTTSEQQEVGNKVYVSKVSLDINSDANYNESLPVDCLNELLDNYKQMALEIAENGDIS